MQSLAPGVAEHRVLFWETEANLAARLAAYVREGLESRERVVVLARAEPLRRLRHALGDVLREAEARRHALVLDAGPLLARLSAGGSFDVAGLRAAFDAALAEVAPHGERTRVYGDLVTLLCQSGKAQDALAAEGMCEAWSAQHAGQVQVLCGYPFDTLAPQGMRATFLAVCDAHTGEEVAPPAGLLLAAATHLPAPGHVVRFFEDDASLTAHVGGFLAEGVRNDEPAVFVGTPRHDKLLLPYRLGGAAAPWISLDAEETLDFIAPAGRPLEARFHLFMASLRQRLPPGTRRFRAFGEMVEILASRGHWDGALELERLWNAYGREHAMALLCGYSSQHLAAAPSSVRHVCLEHQGVEVAEARSRGVVDLLGDAGWLVFAR